MIQSAADDLRQALIRLLDGLPGGPGPLVVYSSLWPLARALGGAGRELAESTLDTLQELAGFERGLALPAFTTGYQDGLLDLDQAGGYTGVLAEAFRRRPGVRRTASAFFSFAVWGAPTEELVGLEPENAWGSDSFYGWMERSNAICLMLGVHPTHCSYPHRGEWLMRHRIPYRYLKQFEGEIIHQGARRRLSEWLFVRSLEPEAHNDFTVLLPDLKHNGLQSCSLNGVPLSAVSARVLRDTMLARLRDDPLFCLKNRADFEGVDPVPIPPELDRD